MNILISGATGFVGKNLTEMFKSKGHDVQTLGRKNSNNHKLDLANEFSELTNEYDYIIHCAGIVHNQVHASAVIPDLILEDFFITKNFLKSIKNCRYKKVIFLSSVSVYGLDNGLNISEETVPKPNSGYGISKLFSEKLFEFLIKKEKLIIFRLPLVNGPNPKGNIFKLEKAILNNRMILFKKNNSLKSLIEITDLFKIILNNCQSLSGIYNIKSFDFKFNDFAKEIAKRHKKKIIELPYSFLNLFIVFCKIFNLKGIQSSLYKLSTDLTFNDSKLINKIK